MRTYTIELRVDYADKAKFEIIKTAAKMAAKHIYSTAVLIQDKGKPEIALSSGDFFSAEEEIMLADDIPTDAAPGHTEPTPEIVVAEENPPPADTTPKRHFYAVNENGGRLDFWAPSLKTAREQFRSQAEGNNPDYLDWYEEGDSQ